MRNPDKEITGEVGHSKNDGLEFRRLLSKINECEISISMMENLHLKSMDGKDI